MSLPETSSAPARTGHTAASRFDSPSNRSISRDRSRRTRRWAVVLVALVAVAALGAVGRAWLRGASDSGTLTAVLRRGDLVVRLTETGVLEPERSITYRSPLAGRETEIVFLAPEGTRVQQGDLLVRLDTTELELELERARQALREAELDLNVAEVDLRTAEASVASLTEGEGALALDEARTRLDIAEKRLQRLREEHASLEPLLDRGYITRDELQRASFELEQAELEVELLRRKTRIFVERTHPADLQRARLDLAQREARLEAARTRLAEARRRVENLTKAVASCELYARRPGLVVHEAFLGASPRRKIRVGDRVTRSQGIVTIPEVSRMLVISSVREADVHRVRSGQPVEIRLDAFPDLRLTGRVRRVGTLAREGGPLHAEGKRFDLVVEVDPSDADLKPEMTARLDIRVGESRDALLAPVNAVFERDDAFVCYVLERGRARLRPVELGDSDGILVEVVSGLEEGDRLLLADPSSEVGGGPGLEMVDSAGK